MKTYNFMIAAGRTVYGTDSVEADTLEEAKQKILDNDLHLTLQYDFDSDEPDSFRIAHIYEVDDDGTAIPEGEAADGIKIPGQPDAYEEGYEAGLKDAGTAVSFMRAIVSVSTQHVRPETVEQLNDLDYMQTVWTPSGFFISCHAEADDQYEPELMDIIAWAGERHRADYILLDCDGEIHNELETFEWL